MKSETTRFVVGETSPHRPRVSRETRRLLMTALLAVLTLWILARVRFPDRPVNPNPVPPLLSQLTGASSFSDLASSIAEVRGRLGLSLVAVVPVGAGIESSAHPAERVPALRIRNDVAVAILEPGTRPGSHDPVSVIAADQASGLALIRTGNEARAVAPALWSPQRLDNPRYVIASSPALGDIALRPVFIGSLTSVETPRWVGPVWALPRDADVAPGAFLFTDQAELVGAVARYEGGLAVVPAKLLLTAADDLLEQPRQVPVDLGIDVQALTAHLSIASGADSGVVVTWVDPTSVAVRDLRAGDVIQAIDGVNVASLEHWRVRVAHLVAGDMIALRVWRSGAQLDVQLMATTHDDKAPSPRLGLTMRPLDRLGAEIVTVERGSAAGAAGIEVGDIITAIGARVAPSPAQVRSSFASARQGDLLIVAVTRGPAHRVVALQR